MADKGMDARNCCLMGKGVDGLTLWQIRGWMPVTDVFLGKGVFRLTLWQVRWVGD